MWNFLTLDGCFSFEGEVLNKIRHVGLLSSRGRKSSRGFATYCILHFVRIIVANFGLAEGKTSYGFTHCAEKQRISVSDVFFQCKIDQVLKQISNAYPNEGDDGAVGAPWRRNITP